MRTEQEMYDLILGVAKADKRVRAVLQYDCLTLCLLDKDIEAMKNADRFIGFADTYENARPAMPFYPLKIIMQYLGKKPDNVIDLGCGTGLSTTIWQGNCNKVIGIEPSDDMRKIANAKQSENIKFIKGYSHETGLVDSFADVVVCSQSFHWMEPDSSLKEINRILKSDGVFATVDCDWPPVSNWQVEKAYTDLFDKVRHIENTHKQIKDNFVRYDKNKHLENMAKSGYFRFTRELVFSNTEPCTADRLIALMLSQGSLQDILKCQPKLIADDVENFKKLVNEILADKEFTIDFSYRMRLGVK